MAFISVFNPLIEQSEPEQEVQLDRPGGLQVARLQVGHRVVLPVRSAAGVLRAAASVEQVQDVARDLDVAGLAQPEPLAELMATLGVSSAGLVAVTVTPGKAPP